MPSQVFHPPGPNRFETPQGRARRETAGRRPGPAHYAGRGSSGRLCPITLPTSLPVTHTHSLSGSPLSPRPGLSLFLLPPPTPRPPHHHQSGPSPPGPPDPAAIDTGTGDRPGPPAMKPPPDSRPRGAGRPVLRVVARGPAAGLELESVTRSAHRRRPCAGQSVFGVTSNTLVRSGRSSSGPSRYGLGPGAAGPDRHRYQ